MTEPFPEKRTRNAEKKCYDKEFNIQAVYPKSRLQRCIVHQIRSSTRFVSWKDIKQVTADLKKIYTSVTLDEAEENLLQFSEKWRKQYPLLRKMLGGKLGSFKALR